MGDYYLGNGNIGQDEESKAVMNFMLASSLWLFVVRLELKL